MKKIFLVLVLISSYIYAMDLETHQLETADNHQNKMREYYTAKRAYGLAEDALSTLLRKKIDNSSNKLNARIVAARNTLSMTKLDLHKCRKWMITHGYLE